MKNKILIEFEDSGISLESADSDCEHNYYEKRRFSCIPALSTSKMPRIVVCPPMEEHGEAGRGRSRRGRSPERRRSDMPQVEDDEDSISSSADSGEARGSCSTTSEAGSDGSDRRRPRSTVASFRRVFQSLGITSRSQSCTPDRSRAKKNSQPKRILRSPVSYTYVRGLSGLPTQRVPRPARLSGLNR